MNEEKFQELEPSGGMASNAILPTRGSLVQETCYGFEGEVSKVFENFISAVGPAPPTAEEWLNRQNIKFTQEQITDERWYRVKALTGGSILSCQSRLKYISGPVADPEPPTPWCIWAKVVATQADDEGLHIYLENRSEDWFFLCPVLRIPVPDFVPQVGDLVHGDAGIVIIQRGDLAYCFTPADEDRERLHDYILTQDGLWES